MNSNQYIYFIHKIANPSFIKARKIINNPNVIISLIEVKNSEICIKTNFESCDI